MKQKMADRLRRSGKNRDAGDYVLSGLASLYNAGLTFRNRLLDRKRGVRYLPVPVISVGNIVAGGTGKTPMVRTLARMLSKMGLKVAILSRGYGGGLEKKGGLVSDGKEIICSVSEAGDEPFLLAETSSAMVYVGADRFKNGLDAVARGANIILLDDGFQHRRLHRDLDLVLVDSRYPLGNGRLLPRGILREDPVGLLRAHALIFTHWTFCETIPRERAEALCVWAEQAELPCFFCQHRQVDRALPLPPPEKAGKLMVFSAIADGRGFADTLRQQGLTVVLTLIFPDHHSYGPSAMHQLEARAREAGADALVTTAKDAVKLPVPSEWSMPLYVKDAEVSFRDHAAFEEWLEGRIQDFLEEEQS
nr:tetraacyldisaccharide 4'-kinase [Desulfobotulus pelophilus]